jgi:cation diffusion facilitator CzcD-associated flavoprotein CzcO
MTTTENVDIVIIGAGFSGLYALHRLRNYHVICFEAGDGVGGTWYWNRYPGARVDIPSMEYSYSFDTDLEQEWRWPEMFSAQPELERYVNYVADRFDLRENIRLSNGVERLRFDEAANRWHVHTAKGDHVVCKYVVAATGALSAPNFPPWPGREGFKGEILHTAAWPSEGVDLTGKRVGQIGTGSTGIQLAPIIAQQAEHLTVFQRTPAFSMPSGNRSMDPDHEREWKENYSERRKKMMQTPGVSLLERSAIPCSEYSAEERKALLEEAWTSQSAFQLLLTFSDIMTNRETNDVVAEFVREKIRTIVKNPATAELLCPKTYPIGAKRLCIDNGYFETFNRDNVSLVDVKSAPIVEFTDRGLRTAEAEYDLDVVVTATGFDAITGAMARIDIEGVGGRKLLEKWSDGPTAWLGLVVAGFPNLLMIHGPQTPGAQAQMLMVGEWQVDLVADIIASVERDGYSRIDTTEEAEGWWAEEVDTLSQNTLHRFADSWYNAKNIEGKKGGFMIYVGGFPRFAKLNREAIADNFKGFIRS